MPQAWERKDSTWEEVKMDASLPPLSQALTQRPVDLTLTTDNRFAAPPKYVWVVRSDHPEDTSCPPKGTDERVTMSINHEHFLSHCLFFFVRHPERPVVPYVRWEFCPDPRALERMFQELKLSRCHMDYFRKHKARISKRLHPVFTEINNGGPYGRRIYDLCERSARALGLFVQAFGDMNAIPCRCCDEAYRRSFTRVVNPTSKKLEKVHAMWPFYGCVSFEPFLNGRCGNCCWAEKSTCDWQFVEQGVGSDGTQDPRAHYKASFDMDNPGAVVQLTSWRKGEQITVDLAGAIAEQEARRER